MKLKPKMMVGVILLSFLQYANASVKIIVHPSNSTKLSDAQIKNIFLGKMTNFPNGNDTIPIVIKDNKEGFSEFLNTAVKKSDKQWRAYWAKALFTGAGSPPKSIASANVIKLVSQNADAISFTTSDDVPDSVKIIKTY